MSEVKNKVIDGALALLAKHERLQSEEQFVRLSEVWSHLRIYKNTDLPKEYVQKVLDENFASRYNGKETIYFLRLK